jgi:hypothetical protein
VTDEQEMSDIPEIGEWVLIGYAIRDVVISTGETRGNRLFAGGEEKQISRCARNDKTGQRGWAIVLGNSPLRGSGRAETPVPT